MVPDSVAVQGFAADVSPRVDSETQSQILIEIYVAHHCNTCAYAYEVAAEIRRHFPQVLVQIVDIGNPTAIIPEVVFATPTYLLNGRVWSLGNPSPAKVQEILTSAGCMDASPISYGANASVA